MQCVEQVLQALRRRLEPTSIDRERVLLGRSMVEPLLRRQAGCIEILPAGAWDRGTACRPPRDVALIVILDPDEVGEPRYLLPDAALRVLRQGLARGPWTRDACHLRERAVNLLLGEVGFDLVPAFREAGQAGLVLPGDRLRWIRSCPEQHRQFILEAIQRTEGSFVPLMQLLRFWNQEAGRPLRGFHLEVMAARVLISPPDGLGQGLAWLFRRLGEQLHARCPDPAGLGPDLDQALSDGARSQVARRLHHAASLARSALDAEYLRGDLSTAHAAWAAIFGPAYGQHREEGREQPAGLY